MNKSFVHLVLIPFTGVGLYGGFRGDEWFKDRIEIFKKYTLESLLNQTEKRFILWITFRPEEKNHPYVAELSDYLKAKELDYVLTFDGLMYVDDKFVGGYSKFKNYGRIVRECWRRKNWTGFLLMFEEMRIGKNQTLERRLTSSLKELEKIFGDVEWIHVTRLDSDDMFHSHAIQEIGEASVFEGAYVYKNGYIYNADTKELAEYNPSTNPPFYTIVFPSYIFFNAQRYINYFKNFKSHEDIPKVFNIRQLTDGRYCVLTHNPKNHISTIWNHPFRGNLILEHKEKILKEFGI